MTSMKNLVIGLAALATLSLLLPASAMAGWTRYDRHSASDPYAYRYEHRAAERSDKFAAAIGRPLVFRAPV